MEICERLVGLMADLPTQVCRTWVLLELRTGAKLAAYMQVARGSVDNCRCGQSGKIGELVGDELI